MTPCSIKAKHWVLRHYLWIAVGLLFCATCLACWMQPKTWQEWIGLLAIPFAFLVTLQKQKTEELMVFKDLFEKFNVRYDEMNEALNKIRSGKETISLTQEEINQLFNYFNLCAEEWFFYSQGYIYPEVWQAWENGMKYFFGHSRVRKLWEQEPRKDSYYGFVPPPDDNKSNNTDN